MAAPEEGQQQPEQAQASIQRAASWDVREDLPQFPAGLRVMVVDDDPLCLKVVEHMLKRCNYEVTTCPNGLSALDKLRNKEQHYDLVLSDVYMPDMDGFKLLEQVGLELEVPVIMMSSNGDTSVVLRGVTHGAVDFLIKPVRIEELRNVWQHVVRKRKETPANEGQEEEGEDDGSRSQNKKRKDHDDKSDEAGNSKKPRVVWSVEMHQQFVNAVNTLGIDKAVPKRILDLMNVEGLTRENVASHLQKYRLYLKRVSGVSNMQRGGKGSKGGHDMGMDPGMGGMMPPQQHHLMMPPHGQHLGPMQQVGPPPAAAYLSEQDFQMLGLGDPNGHNMQMQMQMQNMQMQAMGMQSQAAPDYYREGMPGNLVRTGGSGHHNMPQPSALGLGPSPHLGMAPGMSPPHPTEPHRVHVITSASPQVQMPQPPMNPMAMGHHGGYAVPGPGLPPASQLGAGLGVGVPGIQKPQEYGMLGPSGQPGPAMYGPAAGGGTAGFPMQPGMGDGTLSEMMALRDTILASQQGPQPGAPGRAGGQGGPQGVDVKQEGNMDDILQLFLRE